MQESWTNEIKAADTKAETKANAYTRVVLPDEGIRIIFSQSCDPDTPARLDSQILYNSTDYKAVGHLQLCS